jgi:hypothetical protein
VNTPRILTDEDDPIVQADGRATDYAAQRDREASEQHLRVMIEGMLRQGCGEAEIVAAVAESTGTVNDRDPRPAQSRRRFPWSPIFGRLRNGR